MWITAVECIYADGTVIPSMIIFKGENIMSNWIPQTFFNTWQFSCNSNGWTSNQHGQEWLKRCFDPTTKAKANG